MLLARDSRSFNSFSLNDILLTIAILTLKVSKVTVLKIANLALRVPKETVVKMACNQ